LKETSKATFSSIPILLAHLLWIFKLGILQYFFLNKIIMELELFQKIWEKLENRIKENIAKIKVQLKKAHGMDALGML
jgi:hypothetical protein